jgi:hypothetical protein
MCRLCGSRSLKVAIDPMLETVSTFWMLLVTLTETLLVNLVCGLPSHRPKLDSGGFARLTLTLRVLHVLQPFVLFLYDLLGGMFRLYIWHSRCTQRIGC